MPLQGVQGHGQRDSARSAVSLSAEGHVTVEQSGVTKSEMDPGTNGKPTQACLKKWINSVRCASGMRTVETVTEARFKRWVNSVGTVALPLLAGFSITSVVVVSDDDAKFLWPGATILFLVLAALLLMLTVLCVYHARIYLPKKDPDHGKFLFWAKLARRAYDTGLCALLIGLALVVAPRHFSGTQDYFRVIAAVVVGLACLGNVIWAKRDGWMRFP